MQELLGRSIASLPAGGQILQSLALSYWASVVGAPAAAATEPERVIDGVLTVRTRSSTWSNELSLLSHHIIAELNKKIGKPVIRDIRFRATGIHRKPADAGLPDPTPEDLQKVVLTGDEADALERDLADARSITNEHIREVVIDRVTRMHRVRRWRLDHGGTRCQTCETVFYGDGPLCPICRLES